MGRSDLLPLLALLSVVAMLAIGAIVVFDQLEYIDLYLGVAVQLLLGIGPVVYTMARHRFNYAEPLHPYFATYFLFYGIGALFVLNVPNAAYDTAIVPFLSATVWLCNLGYACLLLGYYTLGRAFPVWSGRPCPAPGWVMMGIIYTVGLLGNLVKASFDAIGPRLSYLYLTGFTSFLSQLTFLSSVALFYVVYRIFARTANRSLYGLLIFWMIPSQLLVLYMEVGNKTSVILTILLPVLAYWYARQRMPWKSLFVGVLVVVFVVFPLYYAFRNVKGAYYTREHRIRRSIEMLSEQDPHAYATDALETVARRLSMINSPAVILRDTGNRVDYQYGRTLWNGIIALAIPRFVWPDKPNINIGIEFGKTFRVTGFGNYSMIAISTVGELYWNFHIAGVVVGMFLMGVWFRAMYRRWGEAGERDPLRLAMYIALLLTTAFGGEGVIGAYSSMIVKQALILWGLYGFLRLFYVRERRSEAAPHAARPPAPVHP